MFDRAFYSFSSLSDLALLSSKAFISFDKILEIVKYERRIFAVLLVAVC